MPVIFHLSHRSFQQKRAVADPDSETRMAKQSKQGQKSSSIDQFTDVWVRNVAEAATIAIRRKSLFDHNILEDVHALAAAAWVNASRLWKLNDSIPQQPALGHVA
jgi:hypothetical protein